MRLRKLVPALIAATSLLALAPAAASAHKHPSPLGRCRINIESIAPRLITAGESTELSGRLAYLTDRTQRLMPAETLQARRPGRGWQF